ncbi:hypothetical protein [Neptuniibacter sp. QD37_11]|uniref:hypothetical protein n=1 Tax=Neptuniibacter sp. QD37_11 TaxID=3398209 RepID=UPI0039F5445B
MSKESHVRCMALINVIESELNYIASLTGHCTFEEFIKMSNSEKEAIHQTLH